MTAGSMVSGVIISTNRLRFSGPGPGSRSARRFALGANLGQMRRHDHGGVGRVEPAPGFEEAGDADQLHPQTGEPQGGPAMAKAP